MSLLPAPYRGINLHPIWNDAATTDQVLALLAQSRVQQVRIDMPLNFLVPQKGQLQPTYRDRLSRFIAGCKCEVLVVASYTPGWANGGQPLNVPWSSAQDFADTIALLVDTWPTVPAWEVWNEPDLDYSWSTASGTIQQRAGAYVSLLKAAAPIIRDAGARVVAPATSGSGAYSWLYSFYAAKPQGAYDVLSAHVYGDPPSHGSLTVDQMVSKWIAQVWPQLAMNGDATRELWFTETGWTTGQGGVSVDQQAANLTATFKRLSSSVPTASRLYWYALTDDHAGGAPNDSYGLLDVNLGQKGDGAGWAALNALP